MFTKSISAAVALAVAVSAQTSTDCNPLTKTCPADPAFGNTKINCDFTKGACDIFDLADGTTLTYNGNGAVFSIEQVSNAPTIETSHYLFFGRVDVVMQAAAGNGIVTSMVLESDDLDEIDVEFVGGDNAQVQSNYFSKGNDATFDRGAYHPVSAPLTSFHTYSIEWTKEAVNWIVDGNVVRTLTPATAQGGPSGYLQTPMRLKLGTWVAGGPNSPEGTAEWAGGRTDFSKAPFLAYYKSVSIVDYAGGDGPATKAIKEYSYGDHSGSWQSIVIKDGNGDSSSGNGGDDTTTTKSKAPHTTKTKAPVTSSTITSTTKAPETTKTKSKTTMTTAAASTTEASNSTSAAPTTAGGTGSETSSAAPSQVTQPGAAVHSVANLGALAIVGAVAALAQLL